MPYAITQNCCTDASCVAACPVNCIHPTPDEPDFGTTDMLYVDPRTCIDCGACADACPVDAVRPAELLTGPLADYPALNAGFYADRPMGRPASAAPVFHAWGPVAFRTALPADFPVLDVAVVGTGPAGMYTVQDLLLHTTARVTVYDRLAVPGGLVRFGVAPDHPATKKIGETFARHHGHERVRMRLGVEVGGVESGGDVTMAELTARHDAVIVAVGASRGRELGVPGENLPGVEQATTVVGWYNGHPEVGADAVDLSAQRVVVVGNGNVALDIARILTADPADLEGTAIARPVLERLRAGAVREVVLLGRRGPADAAYTRPELLALTRRTGVEMVVDAADPATGAAIDAAADGEHAAVLRGLRREHLDWSVPPPGDGPKRLVLRFGSAPEAFDGDGRVQVVRTAGPAGAAAIPAGLVVRAIGHRGVPLPGLPFDEAAGAVPNDRGRVEGMPGVYVVGWIKRGPSGGIGANRVDAGETVGALVDDVVAGRVAARSRRRLRVR
ncbi:MAG: FAD-dependent oxidoreductase [Pseudonocardia sp.]|uniref:FAD-dependent oxidoreductase n=1 Tax=Pseudonocardia sp. TaxID=60912 RepID=UPI001ACBCD9C|nr:FAD-dependent oxidoreductase [Pseudonocardia sp.]MBN9099874.1 FAD-dependent oxidoreductase [Pseudonocardia sp.]